MHAEEPETDYSHSKSGAGDRLQKLLARGGVASRRAAEELITQGRVSVNGHIVKELGAKADPDVDRITVDGQPLRLPTGPATVLLFHKPTGVVTTKKDPEGRTTIAHYLPDKYRHLHSIGRLDFDTSGVLLLTDDGDLTQLLTHPSHGVEKVYWARVGGTPALATIKELEAGIYLEDGKTLPCKIRVRAQTEKNSLVQVTLREGRNRQVRRMLEAVGHQVKSLRRVRFADLGLDDMPSGTFRVLLPGEVHAIRKAAEKPKPALRAANKPPRPTRSKIAESGESGNNTGSAGRKPAPGMKPAPGARGTAPGSSRPPLPGARNEGTRGERPQSPRAQSERPRGDKPASGNAPSAAGRQHPLARSVEKKFQQNRQPKVWGQQTRKRPN